MENDGLMENRSNKKRLVIHGKYFSFRLSVLMWAVERIVTEFALTLAGRETRILPTKIFD
jgi:hypothetical protein